MTAAPLLLGLVTLGRLGELWLARRNTAGLLARGAVEIAPGHYPAIVLMHTAWLAAMWVYGWDQPVNVFWFALFAVLQIGRVWVLGSSFCEWKGVARYFDVLAGSATAPRAAWAYDNPTARFADLAGHVAFYAAQMDEAWVAATAAQDEQCISHDWHSIHFTPQHAGPP